MYFQTSLAATFASRSDSNAAAFFSSKAMKGSSPKANWTPG
jgi:hypothetical protein